MPRKYPKTREEAIAWGLKPFTSESGRAGGLVGGRSKSPKKAYAQRLIALRKKGLNDDTYARLINLMEDRESSELDILLFMEKTRAQVLDVKDRAILLKIMLEWHKTKHGTKENDHKVAAVVLHLTPEEKEEHIRRLTT